MEKRGIKRDKAERDPELRIINLVREKERGNFHSDPQTLLLPYWSIVAHNEEIGAGGRGTEVEIIRPVVEPPPPTISYQLGRLLVLHHHAVRSDFPLSLTIFHLLLSFPSLRLLPSSPSSRASCSSSIYLSAGSFLILQPFFFFFPERTRPYIQE